MTTCPTDRAPRDFNPVAVIALTLVLAVLFLASAEFSTAGDAPTFASATTLPKEDAK